MSILPIKIKLNADLKGYKAGTILTINPDRDLYWRRRLLDSKHDKCLEILIKETMETKITDSDKTDKIKQKQEVKHVSVDKSVDKL